MDPATSEPAANTAPVANDFSYSTDEDVSVEIDVLGNDTDGDTLSITNLSVPANGTATVNGS